MSESNSDNKGFWLTGGDAWAFQSCSPSSRHELREIIKKQVAEYLASGKTIEFVPILMRNDAPDKTFSLHRSPGPGRPKKNTH